MKLEVFVVGLFQENTYVLSDETTRRAFVIDPGGENERIYGYLKQNGLTAEAIVNTHGHVDHIAGAKQMQEDLKIPFRIHKGDEEIAQHAKLAGRMFGVDVDDPPRIDGYLNDGDVLQLGETTVRVIHTPGHSPGGVCLVVNDGDVIVGDTLFASSVGRADLPGGSFDTLLHSIQSKLFPLGDAVRVHPGHGPSTTIGRERRTNPFLT
ncbi:MAG: MBL fold metallo-hydrolase [Myxococcales bacterium]|nr:MAG: MBL fold metallo-hydrolase [Myxococcales bacterium]